MTTTIVPATTEPAITPVFREEDASSIIKIKDIYTIKFLASTMNQNMRIKNN